MRDVLLAIYPWIKAVHVIAVISWMAGMLYLPRLFVYHCEAEPGSKQSETFKVMEEKLARVIMRPAMLVSLALGLVMLFVPGVWSGAGAWLPVKLVLVAGLLAAHHVLVRHRRAFAEDRNEKPQRYFRILNEVPTILMIGIVIMVIVRPF